MILPGATLGMLGGGQLGRMFTVAARTLGYHVIVLDPDPDSPAGRVADEHLHAAYGDVWALDRLAGACNVVTTEFENIPAATLQRLAAHAPVRPSARAVEIAQDRIREKTFVRNLGLPTAPFHPVCTPEDFETAIAAVGLPAILKRAALGYDGKGQVRVEQTGELRAAFDSLGGVACVLERRLDLALEVSVVLARGTNGAHACFPVAENQHRHGILHMSIVPARVGPDLAERAREMALAIARGLDYVGVMAVEFFVTEEGELLVNEIAPRPHNSGHYTLDACMTSQFEQQVRAVCGLPFGDTRLLSPVVMVNLLGDLWPEGGAPDWSALMASPTAKLHLYGKREARPGRKMGHFCVLGDDVDAAIEEAGRLYAALAAGR